MNMQEKIMEIVRAICNMPATDCRSLNKAEKARELLDLVHVPETAEIHEIPLDWDEQVEVMFTVPNDKTYYGLTAGMNGGKFFIELFRSREEGCCAYNDPIPLDHFAGILDGGIRLTAEERRAVFAVLHELVAIMPFAETNRHLGTMTILDASTLCSRLQYEGYCREHKVNFWDMDDDDRETAWIERENRRVSQSEE